MTPMRFFAVFLIGCLAFSIPIVALNLSVDPYWLFDVPRHAGFNANKPAVKTRERLIKIYAAPRSAPHTVILGSSRCDIGVNPASPVWRDGDRPVYNLSLPGANLDELARIFQHVVALSSPANSPRTAIVCLDFEFFLMREHAASPPAVRMADRPADDEFEERLAVLDDGQPNPHRPWRVAMDYANAAFSLNALADSTITIGANMLPAAWTITENGHMEETIFNQPIAADGVADLFADKNLSTIRRFSARHVLGQVPDGAIERLATVHKLVEFARTYGISIIFSIQPSHADMYELLDRMGYWGEYERWKRALAELAAAERRRGADVILWDFGGYESFSQERVPPKNDRNSRLHWFWDPVHYTTALGDLMLARMLDRESSVPYGVELTPENVDERLAAIRRERESYRAREPGEARRRATLFSGVSGAVGKTTAEMWHEDTVLLQVVRVSKLGWR